MSVDYRDLDFRVMDVFVEALIGADEAALERNLITCFEFAASTIKVGKVVKSNAWQTIGDLIQARLDTLAQKEKP